MQKSVGQIIVFRGLPVLLIGGSPIPPVRSS
jgi:hypothetical protein